MKRLFAVIGTLTLALPITSAQETRPEQRQENRQQRQEARQEARQENRPGAVQENRQDRQQVREQRAQRLNNRTQYYNNQNSSQLDAWFQRNNIPATGRVARAAGAVAEAAEKALNTATNVANNTGNQANARFGFTNPNGAGENGWFYDYYTYSPTYYNAPATGTTVYGSAMRYFDLNNDGVYESLNVFRDTDNNASYDAYDRYDFAEVEQAADNRQDQSAEALLDSPEDANRHTVTGKVYASKMAKVNGVETMIVRLSSAEAQGDSQEANIIDIGPTSLWKTQPLKVNDTLTATGPIERIGEKRILIAESVKVSDGKEIMVARGAPKIEGLVVDVTETEVKGKSHTLAVIEAESKRQVVDLGPAETLKVKVEPRTKIVVQGVPVQVRNHSIVQAERVTIDGQELTIKRW